MTIDRFGNQHAPNLSYARGNILTSTEDDFQKLQLAWSLIRDKGAANVFVLTGLDHKMPLAAEDLEFADDEIGPALSFERLKALTLDHFGGTPDKHDFAVFNRLTGATMATHLTLVKPGDTVIGVSETHSHPSVLRAAAQAGARFIDTAGLAAFRDAITRERPVLVVLTRLAVTYDLMPLDAIEIVVRLAHDKGAVVYVDDAGGARVGPAAFEQPKTLELGVDIGATGLDKYGTQGPRFGLLAGRKDLVGQIRAKGFEFGMEARQALYPAVVRTLEGYSPARVRALIDSTKSIAAELRPLLGNRLRETPTTVQIAADDILDIAMERGGLSGAPPVVPYEASAALSMLLLRDHNMLMVHFVGLPPGTADLLIKFVPPETLARFGGPQKYADAVNTSLTKVGKLLRDPAELRRVLLGDEASLRA
jgi:L-seryl-tRNA(Ser) seleniumtransferase